MKKEFEEDVDDGEKEEEIKQIEAKQISSNPRQEHRSHLGRNLVILIVLVAIIAIAYQFAQAAAFQNVQISLAGASIGNVGLTGADLNLELNMYNPGSMPATVSSVSYSIYGNNNYLGSGTISGPISVPPGGTITTPTTFTISYIGAAKTIWSAITGGSAYWEMKGDASVSTLLGPITVPFDLTK